jgi:hypothetical protein
LCEELLDLLYFEYFLSPLSIFLLLYFPPFTGGLAITPRERKSFNVPTSSGPGAGAGAGAKQNSIHSNGSSASTGQGVTTVKSVWELPEGHMDPSKPPRLYSGAQMVTAANAREYMNTKASGNPVKHSPVRPGASKASNNSSSSGGGSRAGASPSSSNTSKGPATLSSPSARDAAQDPNVKQPKQVSAECICTVS